MTPSRKQSITGSLCNAARRILVLGGPGTGKSTFSLSASRHCGLTIPPKERVVCGDVAVFQGDDEGMLGAYHCNLDCPNIYDMTGCRDYDAYIKQLEADLKEVAVEVKAGKIRAVIVDLNLPNELLIAKYHPENTRDWGKVAFDGTEFYNKFRKLLGCTIIGNAHIKMSESPGETAQGAAAAKAQAIGGERTTYVADLTKGVGFQWRKHASLTVAIERKRVRGPGGPRVENVLHTESNGTFEAKSRFAHLLDAQLPGTMSLNAILTKVYGDSL